MDKSNTTGRESRFSAIIFALTVFISAFLLFQIQPVIGKYILPWYGGTPAVWTTCMLVFQFLLLGGYYYAHILTEKFAPKFQVIIHVILVLVSLLLLPVTPSDALKPSVGDEPIVSILLLLSITIGLPYLVLSATGPLLQKWFCLCQPGKTPYRLYALSNIGSLLALVSYPFIIEPALGREMQTMVWSWLMAGFAVVCIVCSVLVFNKRKAVSGDSNDNAVVKPSGKTMVLWLAFPAIASMELLAITSKITQDIAAIPFLWVLPLCIYLLTFIICFDSPKWYIHSFFVFLLIAAIFMVVAAKLYNENFSIVYQIALYSFLLFVIAMVCHGQLFHVRPGKELLTTYYLMISAGGAIGGIFVGIVAPLIFNTYVEFNLGLLGCILLTVLADIKGQIPAKRRMFWFVSLAMIGLVIVFYSKPVGKKSWLSVYCSRNFFGVLNVWHVQDIDPLQQKNVLQHGTTYHGIQFIDQGKKDIATAYYGTDSGVGLAFDALRSLKNRRIGVIGLGVGTVASYGRKDDYFCFYEINPEVLNIAKDERFFSFMSDFGGKSDVMIGDARLVMSGQEPQNYDLLIVDAFSSDSVPVHLLTVEALNVYLTHLDENGIIAFHLSNNHLNLPSVVAKIAVNAGLDIKWIQSQADDRRATFDANWMLLARNGKYLDSDKIRSYGVGSLPADTRLWTDDHVDVFDIMKW